MAAIQAFAVCLLTPFGEERERERKRKTSALLEIAMRLGDAWRAGEDSVHERSKKYASSGVSSVLSAFSSFCVNEEMRGREEGRRGRSESPMSDKKSESSGFEGIEVMEKKMPQRLCMPR